VITLTASPVLSPGASWLLVGCLVAAAAVIAYRAIMAGPDALAEDPTVDHRACEADDSCGLVLCFCLDVDQACVGTVAPGCHHPDAYVCDEHRLTSCTGCQLDAMDDAGMLR
jgi:hypothetical protein